MATNDHPVPINIEDWMRDMEKRLQRQERRLGGTSNGTVTGPGAPVNVPTNWTGAYVPTSPPTETPTIEVVGTTDSFTIAVSPIGVDSVIDYYMNNTLVTSTRATVLLWDKGPEGEPLEPETDYIWHVVVRNELGESPPSLAHTAQLNPGVKTETIMSLVTAGFVLAGQIQVGQILIHPDRGIVIPQLGVGDTILSADGSGNQFAGQGTFDGVDILGALRILGLDNYINGKVILGDGVTNPGQQPNVVPSYGMTVTNAGFSPDDKGGVQRRGLALHHDQGIPGTMVSTDTWLGETVIESWHPTGGSGIWRLPILAGWSGLGGVTQMSGYYYVLARQNSNTANWRILVYQGSDQTYMGSYATNPVAGASASIAPTALPMIGNDGTNLLVAWPGGNNTLYVRRIAPQTASNAGQQVGNTLSNTSLAWPSNRPVCGVQGLDANTWYIASPEHAFCVAYSSASNNLPRLITQEGNAPESGFVGLTVFEGRLVSFNKGMRFYRYTGLRGTWNFSYTWIDGTDPQNIKESAPSTIRTIEPPAMARWTIKLPTNPPDGTTSARLYAGQGNGMFRQAELPVGVTEQTFTDLLLSGQTPPLESDFDNTQGLAPGQIESSKRDGTGAPLISLKGDGSGRTGHVAWDENGNNANDSLWLPLSYVAGNTSASRAAQYRIVDGVVHLRGNVARSSGSWTVNAATAIVSIPEVARPSFQYEWQIPGNSAATSVRAYITTMGALTIVTGATAPAYVTLDSISYRLG